MLENSDTIREFREKEKLNISCVSTTLNYNRIEMYSYIKNRLSEGFSKRCFVEIDFGDCPFYSDKSSDVEEYYFSLRRIDAMAFHKSLIRKIQRGIEDSGFLVYGGLSFLRNRCGSFRLTIFKSREDMLRYKIFHIYSVLIIGSILLIWLLLNIKHIRFA